MLSVKSPSILSLLFGLLFLLGLPSGLAAQDTLPSGDSLPLDSNVAPADTLATVDEDTVAGTPDLEDFEMAGDDTYFSEDFIRFDLSSPYNAIVSHLHFLQPETYHPDSSAMALYVKDPASQAAQTLAIQLKEYMDGAGYFIDTDDLPRDPNYTDSTSGRHKYEPIPEVPEIFVYKKTGSSNWVYSYTTVQAIPSLHSRLFPFGTFDWLPEWTQQEVLGLELWQFLGIIAFLVLAVLFHRLFQASISLILRRFLGRFITKNHTETFFKKIARPISLLLLFYLLFEFVPALRLPPALNQWIVLGFRVSIMVFWGFIALQIVNFAVAIFEKRAEQTETTLDDQLVPLLRRLGHTVVVIALVIIILNVLRVNINALIGGLAFGSLALALAAQDTVKNFFGSILIFIDRPFQVGDWITVDGHEGVVEEVSVRSTRIRTFRGSLITIPNGRLADSAIDNVGARTYRRFVTRIGLTYDTPPDLMEVYVEGLRELIRNHPTTRKDYFEVHFNEMGDFNLQILVYTFFDVATWTEELAGRQRLLLGAMRLADELGVQFAFPTQTLHINDFPEKKTLTPDYPDSTEGYAQRAQDFVERWKENYKPRDLGTMAERGGEG